MLKHAIISLARGKKEEHVDGGDCDRRVNRKVLKMKRSKKEQKSNFKKLLMDSGNNNMIWFYSSLNLILLLYIF